MRLTRSLRVRLTAGFLLLATAAVAVAAATTVLLVEQIAIGTLDAVLLEEATTLADFADFAGDRLAKTVADMGAETDLGPGKFVSVTDANGATIAASSNLPPTVARRRPAALGMPQVLSAGEDDRRFRVAWAPRPSGGRVAIGVNASRSIRSVQRARWMISLTAAALLVVLAVGAWAITGRATRELERLAGEVATVEAGSLDRRLSPRSTDEVDRLVAVLNRVLARLDRSVGQLRRFTADAAHELRTPIAAMRARLEVTLSGDGGASSRDALIDVLEQTERLERLAEDLLMLARAEGGAIAPATLEATVDLDPLVREVVRELVPLAEEQSRALRWTTDAALRVRGSEPLLKRVLVNLVDNAFRHTPAGTPIDVAARRRDDDVVVEVRDEGPPVDPAVLPQLFERFRHGPGGGSGLGLALVREIVERHHGHVTLEAGDRGVCARVVLPLATSSGGVHVAAGRVC